MADVEDTAGGAPDPAPGGRRRWRPVLTIGLAAVAIVAVVVAVLQAGDASDLREERADRREVRRVAAAFGEAYLSYDFDDVDASSEAVRALSTDAFAAGFEETSAPGIQELFASNQTRTTASIGDVFVGDVEDGRARALVIADVEASSAASGSQRLTGLAFILDLVVEAGEWRVSAVVPAPRPEISGPGGAPTSTSTTTTAPTAEVPAP